MKYYVTGDIHGDFNDLSYRIKENGIKTGDCLIILGDAGFNYFQNAREIILKSSANDLGITLFCIRGNHEIRPANIGTYKEKVWNEGKVWYESDFPNLLFAKDGEIYNINGNKALVIGGAYSVDKYYRAARFFMDYNGLIPLPIFKNLIKLAEGNDIKLEDKKEVDEFLISDNMTFVNYGWWKDEQISEKDKEKINALLSATNKFDIILSHTCPLKFEPTEVFIRGLNQNLVDKNMESWLNEVEGKVNYKNWYAGHFHTDKDLNNGFEFLFKSVKEIPAKTCGECDNFIGCGDWNLCCKLPHPESGPFGHLCYDNSEACSKFTEKRDEDAKTD